MRRYKNQLIAAAVLSVLAIIGTIMSSHQAAAQGPSNGLAVNVVQSIPLQVTGSTTITGTPNVNVANPATAAVLSLSVNDPGRIPYQSQIQNLCGKSFTTAFCSFDFPKVPSGHRLVIQHVYVDLIGDSSVTTAFNEVDVLSGPPPKVYPSPLPSSPRRFY